jgi:hypothetical protein
MFKFVTAAFNFIAFAPFLKYNISIMCHYNIMGQKSSERPIIRLHVPVFYFSIAITLKFTYFLVKFCTFGFILKKSATVATDVHFHSDYVISHVCLSHAHSIYAFLTNAWCLETKHDHNSLLTNMSSNTVYASLINRVSYCRVDLKIVLPLQAQG